jgi:hypothetical protein
MNMFQKPKTKKRHALHNPVPTADDRCAICGRPFAELHEVFHGTADRRLSQQYGMQVRLCPEHHRGKDGVHFNIELDLRLKREYQQKFEAVYGHERFMEVFGRNYL